MKDGSSFGAVIGCIIFLCISELILIAVSRYQTEPYMDEVFHIAQAQKFCAGRYSEVKYNNLKCLVEQNSFLTNPGHVFFLFFVGCPAAG